MEVNENIFEGFSAVRMEVNENIFQGFSMTNEKNCEKQSVSQMIDLVMTIQTVTGSSNLELSSGGKRLFKVWWYFDQKFEKVGPGSPVA